MDTQNEKHLVWHAFEDLPAWQKTAIPIGALLISPLIVIFVTLCAVSLFPLFLFGRWEGNLERAPIVRDVARAVRRHRARTEHYYAT